MDDAEELEQCWLMLAMTYLQANKYDEALELCKKVLAVNKVELFEGMAIFYIELYV